MRRDFTAEMLKGARQVVMRSPVAGKSNQRRCDWCVGGREAAAKKTHTLSQGWGAREDSVLQNVDDRRR